ncbi:MAG: hypothetical protein K6A42_01680 [Treponema sp.]|nr:hypothetical protein [Treponema sp.]
MSDSTDSKDLDKYGVWVKNTPKDIKGDSNEIPENAIDDIDLPSDDDMFNDIEFPMTAEDLNESPAPEQNEISDLDIDIDIPAEESSGVEEDENTDTTLSPDELSNITGSMEGGEDENADTTLSPDELLNITENQEIPTEEAAVEEPAVEDGMDDFNIDGLDITTDESLPEESAAEETAADIPADTGATEEVSLDDIPDGEVDLDDFMSDSSSVDSTPDGEVDLDAFMDGGSDASSAPDGDVDLSAFMDGGSDGDVDLSAFMDDAPAKKETKPEEIEDQKSLDIDVSFDDNAEEIIQEEDEESPAPEAAAPVAEATASADDMFDNFGNDQSPKPAAPQEALSGDTEEIDLSDFGFDDDDANIGMTNGPDGGSAPKKEVVDYDMKVSADDDSKVPSVQDVVMGNVESSDDTEIDEGETMSIENESAQNAEQNLEINQKGQEILSQIMGELSNLKDEIKNLKSDFEELKDRPTAAAGTAPIPAAKTESAPEEDMGFFGADDDGDDTIALSGNELTNILSNAEFSTEDAAPETDEEPVEEEVSFDQEPAVEEMAEPEFDETSIGGEDITMNFNEADMEEPKIESAEITPEDLAGTTDEFGEENVLPEEISVPKVEDDITVESSSSDLMDSVVNTDEPMDSLPEESINAEAVDEIMQEDVSIADSLDDEKIEYMEQDMPTESEGDETVVSVDDIVKENVSLQEDSDNVSVSIGDDINAAFDEADAVESEITDTALAEKDAYENSVSDIMKENISLQEDTDDVSVSVGDDIHAAFDEADAVESDIVDDALAEKDAYENSKSLDDEFNLDDDANEEPVPETLDESALTEDPTVAQDESGEEVDMSIFDEPVAEDAFAEESSEPTIAEEPTVEENAEPTIMDESSVDEPTIEEEPSAEPEVEKTVAAAPSAMETTSISKNLKTEIVSVLSYMDQLLENLPEDKITEFAKSEHFVTYKKLFDELGLS